MFKFTNEEKINKIFSGWQESQGVKILHRFRDWLRATFQGDADGLAKPKLSARERCIRFCRCEVFESYN